MNNAEIYIKSLFRNKPWTVLSSAIFYSSTQWTIDTAVCTLATLNMLGELWNRNRPGPPLAAEVLTNHCLKTIKFIIQFSHYNM